MVLKKHILLFCALFIAFSGLVSADEFYPLDVATKKAQKILGDKKISLIGIPSNFEGLPVEIIHKQISIFEIQNAPVGLESSYILFTSTKGRFEYFDYAVALTEEGKVGTVKVVKYRSEHGSEVTSKKWLSQFMGYSGEKLEYGKDIQAISGATKSASSLTNDIPVALMIFKNTVK